MKTMAIDAYGGAENLHEYTAEQPVPGEGQLLIRIRAIGVNPADTKWRAGMFANFIPLSFPYIPGYDVAGTIEGGPAATGALEPGTHVVAMLDPMRAGAYAEWAVATSDRAAPLSKEFDFAIAAAIPTPGLTGVQMIDEQLNVQAGQVVLITGATGAVGRFAVYAAKLRGATVVAAVRASQREEALALGADRILTLGEEDWNGPDFHHVADTIGGPVVAVLCRQVRLDGMIRTVSTTPIPPEGLPVEPAFFAVHEDAKRLTQLAAAVAAGQIKLPAPRVFSLAKAAEAHRLVEAGGAGKIILLP